MKEACLFFSTSNQLIARFRDARNIKDIGKKLESIARDHARFGSIVSELPAHQTQAGSVQAAGSQIISDVVIGRDVERNTIISMLSDIFISSETLSVASIVGIGGVGKTTLARYVYRDERVKCCFDVRFWVDATKGFCVEEVLEKILASAMDEMPRRCGIDQLYHHFLEAIAGKKFLLVLDNIWDNGALRLIWIELKKLLAVGAYGSKLLITTRDQKVAATMDSTSPYMLGDLTEDDSWLLFKQIAFTQLQEPGVKAIGKEIAKMCPNVPLVIRSIGGLLAGKITKKEWEAFRNDQLANFSTYGRDIMHTLKFSYDQLDAKMKLCVAYCSLFPKGFEYDKDEMIRLWICLGYVEPQYKNQSLEEAGEEYILSLLNCGFFQRSCGLKMHDVMHDAVVMLAGHKYKMVDSNTVEFDERVHHVSVGNVVDSSWDVLSSLSKIKYLESFLVVSRETNLTARNWFIYHKVMLSRFQCLKILDLHGIWIKKLPKSLGELICLRHLDLSETAIVKLPNSVVQLVNLLSLQLYSCINLQELPKDMSNLVKLRHLQLSECSELIHMPKGLGKLTNLQTLSVFVVREKSSRSKFEANDVGGLEDLKHLNHLKGELSIQVCKQPKDIVLGARMANLRRKEKLIDLSIDFRDSTKEDEAVLEGLQPHANLRYLKIQGYGGERLPSWMINDNLHCRLPNLIQIKILNCKSCRYLCHLGRLPYLKVLFLEGLDNVEYIEKYTSSSSNSANDKGSTPESLFPSLDTFRLKGIPKLKGWWNMSSIGDHDLRQHHDFQYQNHLTVWRPAFPKLKALTTDSIELAITIAKGPGFASLEHLYIKHNSRASLPLCQQQTPTPLNTCFPNLRCLQLSGNPEIEALPDEIQDLFYLEYLRIDNCKQLKAIPEWIDSLRSLTSLYIWECPRLESLPHQISNLSNLRLLGISKCSAVLTEKCLCKNPTGEYWPYIQHIPYINIRLSNQNPTGEYWPYI
ncbi:putative disease resistance protein At3g14460 [Chenopodium quinoa]|uniref:putative disease resistance protein At3g14460 n=1 Tax=Chenopodium quinoa TaxID=63459 RepID=UPI000B77B394|nr:putative disease resistance protein At3g14460 [Chenopodium quinoa]